MSGIDASVSNPLLLESSRPLPKKIGIIGAGTIGPDIGYYLKSELPDLTLVLVDIVPAALDQARARIEGYAAKGLKKGKLTAAQARNVTSNLITTSEYMDLVGCDWVLEAATENLELKKIFTEVAEVISPEALITSNTSSLPAERLFSHLKYPGRATVTHFFAPAFRNPAVEVVAWEQGDPEVVDYLRRLFCATGKVPLVTADKLCFMLDRVFDNWCNEAALLLADATAAEVDSVANHHLVHAGPFFVLNLAHGNPIIVETNTLQMEEGAHYRPADIFRSVETWKTLPPGKKIDVPADTAALIRDRLSGILFSQSFDILDRQIGTPADLNLGCVLALGFKQGPLDVMRDLGADETRRIAERFCADRPGMPAPQHDVAGYQDFSRHLLVDDVDGVKVLTLRRPQAMNALDDTVTDELLAVIKELEGDPAVAGFVLTGYGPRAFSAGADIGRFPEVLGDAAAAAQYARDCSRLLLHLDQMDKPVVAALNGFALGGGLELALRCHGIVADEGAWLQLPEITLGIAPGIGGMVVPYRRWPAAAAEFNDMIRLARKLDAQKAKELGVVDEIVKGYRELIAAAVQRVKDLAGQVAAPADQAVELGALGGVEPLGPGKQVLSREVIGIIEQAIKDAAAAPSLEAALEVGYQAFGASACTAAAKEGVGSFLGRRKPDFETTG